VRAVELWDEDFCGSRCGRDHFQRLHRREQAVQAQAGSNAGQFLFREQASQVVVTTAGAHAADRWQVSQKRFVDRSRVVVETSRDRQVETDSSFRQTDFLAAFEKLAQLRDAFESRFAPGQHFFERLQNLHRLTGQFCEVQDARRLFGSGTDMLDHLGDDFLAADLRKLVQRSQNADRLVAQADLLQQTIQDEPIVDSDVETLESDLLHQIVDDQQRLNVCGVGVRSNGVEVALHEFAVATFLSVLAAPDLADVIPLEGSAQFPGVLSRESGQRDRQVKPQGDVAVAVIGKAVKLLVRFVAAFAEQNLRVFQRGSVDRAESVAAVHSLSRFDQLLASDHGVGQVIPKSLQGTGLDQVGHSSNFSSRYRFNVCIG